MYVDNDITIEAWSRKRKKRGSRKRRERGERGRKEEEEEWERRRDSGED